MQASIDYKFLASHKPGTPSTPWTTASPNDAYATEVTISRIFNSFAANGLNAPSTQGGVLLSDRMKDQYFQSGVLPGFMGLNWYPQEAVYDPAGSGYTGNQTNPGQESQFLKDDALILGNFTENRPIEMFIGPTADDEAPENYTGKFAKTWKEKDPSARQYLLEWNLLPVITMPEQFVYVNSVV